MEISFYSVERNNLFEEYNIEIHRPSDVSIKLSIVREYSETGSHVVTVNSEERYWIVKKRFQRRDPYDQCFTAWGIEAIDEGVEVFIGPTRTLGRATWELVWHIIATTVDSLENFEV